MEALCSVGTPTVLSEFGESDAIREASVILRDALLFLIFENKPVSYF